MVHSNHSNDSAGAMGLPKQGRPADGFCKNNCVPKKPVLGLGSWMCENVGLHDNGSVKVYFSCVHHVVMFRASPT